MGSSSTVITYILRALSSTSSVHSVTSHARSKVLLSLQAGRTPCPFYRKRNWGLERRSIWLERHMADNAAGHLGTWGLGVWSWWHRATRFLVVAFLVIGPQCGKKHSGASVSSSELHPFFPQVLSYGKEKADKIKGRKKKKRQRKIGWGLLPQ